MHRFNFSLYCFFSTLQCSLLLLDPSASAFCLLSITSRAMTIRPTKAAMFMAVEERCCDVDVQSVSRRFLFAAMPASILVNSLISNECCAHAVMMEQPKDQVFSVGEALGVEKAKARFREARKSLDDLIENYDDISKGGGDAVRRYLGTVGTDSALFGIMRVLKELKSECDDVVEYSESMDEFDYYLRSADTAVYSANFVEYSAAKTKPEKFFADAKADAFKMKMYMDKLAAELSMDK